jgi:hypothetical protein
METISAARQQNQLIPMSTPVPTKICVANTRIVKAMAGGVNMDAAPKDMVAIKMILLLKIAFRKHTSCVL